jgi:amidase
MTEPSFASAAALAADIRARRISSVELLDHLLARAERLNGPLNAIVAFDREGARRRAAEADAALARGESRGPLHGIPTTIKDSYEVAGMPAVCGVPELARHVPERSAHLVRRLEGAGAIVFGKTNVPTWAGDLQSYNPVYGVTNNPWDTTRTPGGSSGGAAAAVAAGLTPLELGSDIGGSIRTPAHFCGVYGHKPSWNAISMEGHMPPPPGLPYSPTDMGVGGPLARSAGDLALALSAIAGPDRFQEAGWQLNLAPPKAMALREYRVAAWLGDPALPIDDSVRGPLEAACDALEKAGSKVDRKARPAFDPTRAVGVYFMLLNAVMGSGLPPEVLAGARERVAGLAPDDFSNAACQARGLVLSHADWLRLDTERAGLRLAWDAFFRDYDVLLCPNHWLPAFKHDHGDFATRTQRVNGRDLPYFDGLAWAGIIGVAYLPGTSAPVGRTAEGLPVNVQIVGPYLGDYTTIAFAGHLAQLIGGYEKPPGY